MTPSIENPRKGQKEIGNDAKFSVDLEKKEVSVSENGNAISIGDQISYVVG